MASHGVLRHPSPSSGFPAGTRHVLLLLGLLFQCVGTADGQPSGNVRIEPLEGSSAFTLTFHSAAFGDERSVLVGLPSEFDSTQTYPLVAIMEGERLFDTVAPLTRLMTDASEIPPVVVVGIPAGDMESQMEFAPPSVRSYQAGNADRMLDYLARDLVPVLDSLYATGDERIIWGHSALGGTFLTYLLLGPDTLFSGILSSSPNLRWVTESLEAENAFATLSRKGPVFYYLTFGDSEPREYMGEMFGQVRRFGDRLKNEAPGNLTWKYRLYADNNHFSNAIETYIDGLKLYFGQ